MHELGIVMKTIEQVEDIANANSAEGVTKITLEIGEVSGVVESYFTDCFKWAKAKTNLLKDCQLQIIWIKGISYCADCKSTFDTTTYAKICPKCGSEHTYLVSGDEINIKEIEVI